MEGPLVPEDILVRVPLMRSEWMETYRFMGEHPDAPRWHAVCGDRVMDDDLPFIEEFARALRDRGRARRGESFPRAAEFAAAMARRSAWFARALAGKDPLRDWDSIETMSRPDMRARIHEIVPADEDLDRLVVNPTAGTTGHPVPAPNHPKAVACYDPMIAYVLERHGLRESTSSRRVAAIQICDQARTIAYHAVHSVLDGAGFAKVNLRGTEWRSPEARARYVADMDPLFLSGDPYAYLGAIDAGIRRGPRILLSTAVAMEAPVRARVEAHFGVRVAQMYSLNETGPIGYECPANPGSYHVLPTDLLIECLDAEGMPAGSGERGEICATGGRNPFVPLLRYRTGDTAILDGSPCPCGEESPLLRALEARSLVVFDRPDGGRVNPVDVAGIARREPIGSFRFTQRKDGSCLLECEALAPLDEAAIARRIDALFGSPGISTVSAGFASSGPEAGKVRPFIKEE